MKKIVLMVLCSFMSTAFAGGSVHVEDRALLDGGHELLLTGSPEVIMESERGMVYSGQTHILTFDDQSQRRHHKDGVRYITNDGMIFEGLAAIEYVNGTADDRIVFINQVLVSGLNMTKSGSTTFSCSGGIVYRDGTSTGQTQYVYRNVVTISCDADDGVVVKPRTIEP